MLQFYDTEDARLAAIEAQQRWEMEAVDRGAERYRNELRAAIENGTEADLPPGKRMMAAILAELVPLIEKAQEQALEELPKPRSFPPLWCVPILSLKADKMAVITARTALTFARQERVATQLALEIANRCRDQRNMELWQDAERAKVKAAKAEGRQAVDLFKVMTSRVKKLDARTVRKWQKKADDFDKVEWDLSVRTHFGLKLLSLLCESGGWFEMYTQARTERGRVITEKRVALTAIAREFLHHHHAQSELTRPWLLPMICPPNDWRVE